MNIKNYLQHPLQSTFYSLVMHGYLDKMSDKEYLGLMYKMKTGKKLNLESPTTFNEKIQWLKLNDRRSEYSNMVDKYEVKRLIKELIGEEYVIPAIGVWDSFEDIKFDLLPERFVLKTTHDSGGVVICRDKKEFNIETAREKLVPRMTNNYFYRFREWPYKNVKPRILCEEYMEDTASENLPVYKVLNFGGEPKIIQVIQDDKTTRETIDYFDTDWNLLPFRQNFPNSEKHLTRPDKLDEILSLARLLSKDFAQIRTDFYVINGKVFFSEFTFYSDCGFANFEPESWDYKLGSWIKI